MFTTFWSPREPDRHLAFEPTFVIEHQVAEHADAFVEYVGEYAQHSGPHTSSIWAAPIDSRAGSRSTAISVRD